MRNKSVMVHSFSEVPRANIPRSSFDRSHGLKSTFDADYLIPILCDDVIPGDSFNVSCHFAARLTSPTVLPLMDNMFFETFFFFVPYRLVWDNWEKFCGAQDNPGDSIDFTIPVLSGSSNLAAGDLGDHFGLPINYACDDFVTASALPLRAYRLIYNEWFRSQDLENSVPLNTGNGPDAEAASFVNSTPFRRAKRHDYFTSALPWPQKGTAVSLPLGSTAPVYGLAIDDTSNAGNPTGKKASGESPWSNYYGPTSANNTYLEADGTATYHNVRADLSSATAATVNDVRLAFQTQRLLERDARSGTRYVETVLAHYGVVVPDFRVQRPEFLGGGSSQISVSPVAQTTYQGTATIEDGKGALAGIGSVSGTHGFTKSFVEHGVIIGLANVRGDITYSQGIERYWDKQTRYDFYYPVLANIGEQSILNREIFFQNTSDDDNVFGYQERYAEYRYKPSRLTGLMRPDATGALDSFHLSEDFASLPTLGTTFIRSNTRTPLDRALSVPSQPQFVADFYFSMKCARPMPLYGVPGNLDHF